MAELIKCKAKTEFTVFVEGHGMVVGAPESTLPEAKNPMVPAGAVQRLIDEGKVHAPKGWKSADEEAPAEEAPADAAPDQDAPADEDAPAA